MRPSRVSAMARLESKVGAARDRRCSRRLRRHRQRLRRGRVRWSLLLTPRSDWQAKVESQGLVWHTAAGAPYWNESACYRFSPAEIEEIETATAQLYVLFLEAGDYVVRRGLFDLVTGADMR